MFFLGKRDWARSLISVLPHSQDCIRTSDDLKMRLEKPILFARADKDHFQINPHYLRTQIMSVSLR